MRHAEHEVGSATGNDMADTTKNSVDLAQLRQQSLQLACYLSALDLKGREARSRVRRMKRRVRKTLGKYRQQLS
jgi:hypothetical protein